MLRLLLLLLVPLLLLPLAVRLEVEVAGVEVAGAVDRVCSALLSSVLGLFSSRIKADLALEPVRSALSDLDRLEDGWGW
jgi:hypothetical protein